VPPKSGNRFHRICADRADAEQSTKLSIDTSLPLCHLSLKKGPEGLGHLLMVLHHHHHHHLETVAQIGLEVQKMVAAGMEDSETTFPHMD
jgi:hypothetical protein